ncbi:MAG TPA: hypothetical protein VHM19_06955, partial [Polyangiales bacterium]|nr:hypothetical protein [Polyangiales bacterium]
MKRIDLHADALLDRARAGTLRPGERTWLDRHCQSCAACALELRIVEDGLHARGPTVQDDARGWAAVDAVLGGGVELAPAAPSLYAPRSRSRSAGRAGRVRAGRAVALSFLGLFVTSAAAAFFTGAA